MNIKVTTRQGIDYVVHTKSIPLYLKILSFLDRHFQYKELANDITYACRNSEEKALAILRWTYENIHHQPKDLSVIDDHVWHIIIRGYGVRDQLEDVFATLCNYVGIIAFYDWIRVENTGERKPFSFIRLKNGWSVFDVYNGVYFKNLKGEVAILDDLLSGSWKAVSLSEGKISENYSEFFKNLKSIKFEKWRSTRTAIQSPINRLIFWFKYKY